MEMLRSEDNGEGAWANGMVYLLGMRYNTEFNCGDRYKI